MGKVVDVVQQTVDAGAAAGIGFQLVRLYVLAEIDDAALGAVHHHAAVLGVEVDERFLTPGIAQFHAAAPLGCGLHGEVELEGAVVGHIFYVLFTQLEVA